MGLYNFHTCKDAVLSIIDGNTTIGQITNQTISHYLWDGPVQGLHASFPRADYLAITYQGMLFSFFPSTNCKSSEPPFAHQPILLFETACPVEKLASDRSLDFGPLPLGLVMRQALPYKRL